MRGALATAGITADVPGSSADTDMDDGADRRGRSPTPPGCSVLLIRMMNL
jgi:hypothetical protein